MGSLNRVTLLGRLGKDPETRNTTSGNAVCNFTLATSEKRGDGSGGQTEHTEWHRIVCFGRQAEVAQQYLKKGHMTLVEGRLQTREYTQENVKKYATEIVVYQIQLIPQGEKRDAAPAVPAAAAGSWEPVKKDADEEFNF